MAKLPRWARSSILALIAIGAVGAVAMVPRARASFRAAYIAFRDPSRVRDPDDDGSPATSRLAPNLDQPELGADFGRGDETDIGDAGLPSTASLVVPDLHIPIGPRTLHFVSFFTGTEKGREAFAVRFRRSGRYKRYIEQAMRDAELPEDLLWLCAIESGFEPQATSPKGSAGLFQLSPETGNHYGLIQSEATDERRSLTRGTAVGVMMLRDLFDAYGQWDLALAAYHLGRERIDDAITRLRERRSARDRKNPIELQDLVDARLIPKETANFVPQVHAFAIVAANRGRFGLDDLDVAPAFDLGEVAVPESTPLRLVAKAAGVSISVLRDYNPGLLRDRTPPEGGDTLVSIPADRVASTLAAFPALYAREMGKLSDAGSALPPDLATRATAKASSTASASAASPAPPAPPSAPPPRLTLPSGIVVEQRAGSSGSQVEVGARVEVLPRRAADGRFEVTPLAVGPGELASALERLARAVHVLVSDTGDAAAAARRRAGDERRQRLARAPYGLSWLAVGERLFPSGHPLAGTVLWTPTMPLTSVAIADAPPRSEGSLAVTVTIAGADAGASAGLVERAFAGAFDRGSGPPGPHEGVDRIDLTEVVPAPRVVFAWLAPSGTEPERAALRLAILAVAHNEVGKVARTLVAEKRVAAHVRGFLDLGDRASVASLEIVPAVPHPAGDVETELDAALASFADVGPTAAELVAAKAQHRARVQAEQARAGTTTEPREAALARLGRLSAEADAVSATDLRDLVKRVFTANHRVVVVTSPRR